LFAVKGDTHLIDLEQTALMLRRALDLVKRICEKRGSILFIVADGDSSFRPSNVDLSESREEHPLASLRQDPGINAVHLDQQSPEIQTVSSPSRHACLVGGSKVLAELSRGGL
jgi:hypothetical protein